MKRETILALVRAYVAEEGYCSQRCVRLYIERRISHASWKAAIAQGLAAHKPKESS